jgi:hypothetical protein
MAAMSACPACGSDLIQPLRTQAQPDGGMLVELRCPACFAWSQAPCTRRELAQLDRQQAAARQLLLDAYDRCVAESMEALGQCLGAALALDLIDADDFARRPAGAWAASGAEADEELPAA